MAAAIPGRSEILRVLETVAIGSAGGLLFLWANLPGGLISGAMITVGIAALAGRQLAMPPILTQTVLLLLGISLGSLMSRQLIQHMSAYPLTIGLLALATFCSTFGSSLYLQRVHGWDQTSAFLAGSPGALSQITILAAEKGADVGAIAVVQTIRVIILTAALPLVLVLTGVAPSTPPAFAADIASPADLAALIAASVAVALLLRLLKFPASWMFGAMLASSVLHGSGLVEGGLPPWMRNVALVGIGALIGSRFARVRIKTLLAHVNARLGSFALARLLTMRSGASRRRQNPTGRSRPSGARSARCSRPGKGRGSETAPRRSGPLLRCRGAPASCRRCRDCRSAPSNRSGPARTSIR